MTRTIKVAFAAVLILAGCDSDSTEVIDRNIETVQLVVAGTQVEAGQTVQLAAVAKTKTGTVRTDVDVEWTVSDTTIATLTPNGHTAVLKGKRAGVAGVLAKVAGKADLVQIEVTQTAPANPVPLLDRLEPAAITAGTAGTVVKVKGFNFRPGSVVRWNGTVRQTTYVSENELTFVVTPLDITTPGDADIRVFTPTPGGGASQGSLTFTIYGPAALVSITGPSEQIVWLGEQTKLDVVVKDALGRVLNGLQIDWSSNDPAIASVDPTGRVTARREGYALVSARVGQVVAPAGFEIIPTPDADLIFDALDEGVRQLFVVTPGPVLNRRKLLADGTAGTQAAVTFDGQRIAFTGIGANGSTEIFTVNRDGSGLRQLTWSAYADDQPTWSPDGQRIAFRSRRNFGYSDVWVMNADGSDQKNLTDYGVRANLTGFEHPTWSPDGQHIIYGMADEGMTPRRSTLMKMRVVDRLPEILIHDLNVNDYEPAYSPNGTMLAMRRNTLLGGNQILFVNPVNGDYWILLNYPGHGSNPAWSPDSKWLAIESSPFYGTATTGVYVNMVGTYLRKGVGVGTAAGNPANPVWMAH